MEMRYAVIEEGVVTNIALADAPMGDDWIEATDAAQIGGTWDGQVFGPVPQPDPAAQLAAWRRGARLSKAEFVLGLIMLEILTLDDAISASRGEWPSALSGFLDYLTPQQAAQVQIEWATRAVIGRVDTYVLVLASYLNLTDAQVDTLFGWAG